MRSHRYFRFGGTLLWLEGDMGDCEKPEKIHGLDPKWLVLPRDFSLDGIGHSEATCPG